MRRGQNGWTSARKSASFSSQKIKSTFGSIFKTKRKISATQTGIDQMDDVQMAMASGEDVDDENKDGNNDEDDDGKSSSSPFTHRALPPLPPDNDDNFNEDEEEDDERRKILDYAESIERVKDCGWYWGPISGEMSEKLLANEPDGSFIVRDSSDEHYIFSLTFKLNGLVRHVRIDHDQGNFSFGSLQKFRSNTIVDFIENAVQHSRSGLYLFFLHRRPVMGPMRVQLFHPVSRFKRIQSLQHLCRFVILKHVRRDLLDQLPLPQRLKLYLKTPYYYFEEFSSLENVAERTNDGEQSSNGSDDVSELDTLHDSSP